MASSRSHAAYVRSIVAKDHSATLSSLAASWRRSMLHYGLAPEQNLRATQVSSTQLGEALGQLDFLMHVARPTLEKLFQNVSKSGCCVVLSDMEGVILNAQSQAGDDTMFNKWGLTKGAIWSESCQGTNGIGTCVAEQRPVVIHRDQHFKSQNTMMSCMGAPVFDGEGKMIAVLDISSCRNDMTSGIAHVFGKVVSDTAQRIEQDYFRATYQDARVIIAPTPDASATALFAVDQDDLVIGANRHARRAFGVDQAMLTAPKPISDIVGNGKTQPNLQSAEKSELRRAIARTKGNISLAAKTLGISRATLYRRMQKLGLTSN